MMPKSGYRFPAAVIYQIYPRSLQNSGRDGVEDLPGIIRRRPYLAKLAVNVVMALPDLPLAHPAES
jgi:glycosidase